MGGGRLSARVQHHAAHERFGRLLAAWLLLVGQSRKRFGNPVPKKTFGKIIKSSPDKMIRSNLAEKRLGAFTGSPKRGVYYTHISLPFEGMPASLGPGLRTVSGAKVSTVMAVAGFTGLEERPNTIDTKLSVSLRLPRGDRPRHVSWRWQTRPFLPRSEWRPNAVVSRAEAARESCGFHRHKRWGSLGLPCGDRGVHHAEKRRGSGSVPSIAPWHKRNPPTAILCHFITVVRVRSRRGRTLRVRVRAGVRVGLNSPGCGFGPLNADPTRGRTRNRRLHQFLRNEPIRVTIPEEIRRYDATDRMTAGWFLTYHEVPELVQSWLAGLGVRDPERGAATSPILTRRAGPECSG